MPKKKGQAVLQRKIGARPPAFTNITFLRKTAIDAKSNVVEDAMRLGIPLVDTTDSTECTNTNYLHKKFKKVAEVAKDEPTANGVVASEGNRPNGAGAVTFESSRPVNGVKGLEDVRPGNGLKLPEVSRATNGGWSEDEVPSAQPGRYVCHYCQMVCAKPSVLQKHLRAHTNERPYPCAPCGFAFKTKSNLYKHCRSQAHRVKAALGEPCDSAESDTSESSSEHDNDTRPGDAQPRIYKPKFHKATFYQDEPPKSTGDVTPKKITSPEQLEERITKIIRDNQMIFDTMEPQFSRKFLLRQNSREKESSSPKSEVDTRKTNETKSKLALALMKVDRNEHSFSPSYPQVNSENHTYQPLNLTKKLAPPNASAPSGPSHRMADSSGDRLMASPSVPRTDDEYESDIGPLLGTTPLIEAPTAKKRRVQSTTLPPDPRGLSAFNARRLSTSSLPSTLKSLEELSRHPMKQPGVAMFGGEVKIMEGGELRTVRISASSEVRTSSVDSRVVTVANVGLLASGGTLVSPGPPAFHMANILNTDVSGISLTPNVVTPNLAVPGVPQPESGVGVLTIMHGETAIPFVPGMPGPQSLQPDSPRKPKLTLSSLSTVQKPSSSSAKLNVPNDVPKIEISSPPAEEKPSLRKFLRPTSLPLKPGSFTPKRLHQGTTPTVLSLVSPETPRPKKSYGQLFLSGHAYTYLGLKCSTRSYYCTISRPQPMYVMQSPKLPRLSMYSNWKVYSETDSLGLGLTPGQAMACYESRFRTGGFTTADSRKNMAESAIVTHSSSWTAQHSRTSQQETSSEPEKKRLKICNGGYESLEEYTYVRGRGRGRYVCEECGIRCKKPSMLKKHIRTHSDVRPYTCSHCAFAFKTKGNLTKHMASKAHYNRCCELGVDPTPPAISDCDSDRHEESNSSDGESDDSDDDDDSNGGTESLEREAACGLLSLSASPNVSQYVAAGLLPRAALDSGPASYPYSNVAVKNVQVQTEVHPPYRERDETPMDLSQKEPDPAVPTFLSKDSQFLRTPTKPPVELKSPQEADRPPVPAYLAAGIANAQENQTVEPPGGHMLQAYLTAKALRDVQFKQKLRSRTPPPELPSESSSPPPQPLLPASTAAHLSAAPSPGRPEETLAAGSTSSKLVPDAAATETPSRIMVVGDPNDAAKRVVVNLPSSQSEVQVSAEQRLTAALSKSQDVNLKAEFFPPASGPNHSYFSVTEDGRSICVICNKTFNKPSQLRLHVNIHYFERPFRCDACGVSFRTRGHLQKHERSVSHHNKVSMNTTFGAATVTNPRPFKCDDCKIAFRIHGHLAKHLRSKMHIMKLECLGKLPFGTYAELERSGYNLNEIDTTDCDNSLESLQSLAQKLYEKDSSKFGQPPPKILDDGAESDGSSSEGLHSEHVQCGMCGDAFDSSAALQIHMIDHGKDAVLDKRKSED